MKKSYFAKFKDVKNHDPVRGPTPNNVWQQLEKATAKTREELKAEGWRVKLDIDLEESDVQIAVGVVETVAPKPVGKIVGFLRRIFG